MKIMLVGDADANALLAEKMAGSRVLKDRFLCLPAVHAPHSQSVEMVEPYKAIDVAKYAKQNKVDVVILTSWSAVESGLAHVLEIYRIPCLGPTRVAAHFRENCLVLLSRLQTLCNEKQIENPSKLSFGLGSPSERLYFGAVVYGASFKILGQSEVAHKHLSDLATEALENFVLIMRSDETAYNGLLCVDYAVTETGMVVTRLCPTLSLDELKQLSRDDKVDWLQEITSLLAEQPNPFRHVGPLGSDFYYGT